MAGSLQGRLARAINGSDQRMWLKRLVLYRHRFRLVGDSLGSFRAYDGRVLVMSTSEARLRSLPKNRRGRRATLPIGHQTLESGRAEPVGVLISV
jgi:hypothetical protein